MAANQPSWPRRWLMTDERLGDRLWKAIDALPKEAGIIFRHYNLPPQQRLRLGREVAAAARERKLVLGVVGSCGLAEELGAALVHKPDGVSGLPLSLPVHNETEAAYARRAGASLIFISPLYATKSHPSSPALNHERAAKLARSAHCPAIALGGMNERRFTELETAFPGEFHGYAGIECWLE